MRQRMERIAGRLFSIKMSVMVTITVAVVATGAGLMSSSMTAAYAAVLQSSDLSSHGAFVPGTPDSVVGIAPTPDDLGYRTITANSFVSGYGDGFTASEPILGIRMWWEWSVLTRPATIQGAGGR